MSKKYQQIARDQCRSLINKTDFVRNLVMPREGWIRTVRKALGMSGRQLGQRLCVSRADISQLEASELEGRITLKKLHDCADAMGCQLVYALVPKINHIESVIEAQATRKAKIIVDEASVHMALEDQQLSEDKNEKEIQRLKADLIRKMPWDFWDE